MKLLSGILLASLFLLVPACGGSDGGADDVATADVAGTDQAGSDTATADTAAPAAIQGSCSMGTAACTDYSGQPAEMLTSLPGTCEYWHDTWSDQPCPTAGIVGTCTKDDGAGRADTHYYTGDAASLESTCTTGCYWFDVCQGTWSE